VNEYVGNSTVVGGRDWSDCCCVDFDFGGDEDHSSSANDDQGSEACERKAARGEREVFEVARPRRSVKKKVGEHKTVRESMNDVLEFRPIEDGVGGAYRSVRRRFRRARQAVKDKKSASKKG